MKMKVNVCNIIIADEVLMTVRRVRRLFDKIWVLTLQEGASGNDIK